MTATTAPLLRFITAGSVDDGKSTLIGRLLYDSKTLLTDQLDKLNRAAENGETPDFASLTDGLAAEREQGITIDVAYRYFATPKRKFIIADTPGHEQYTRNMVTGASTADAAIILVDATRVDFSGSEPVLLPQTKRHSAILKLLGCPNIIVAVNKLDLLDFDEAKYQAITEAYRKLAEQIGLQAQIHFLPISALKGDNIVNASSQTPWYQGLPLLPLLESLPVNRQNAADQAALCWFDDIPLNLRRKYLLKHTTQTTPIKISEIAYVWDVNTLSRVESAETLKLNDIGSVSFKTQQPLAAAAYEDNHAQGAFILIDEATNHTVAAGMIRKVSKTNSFEI